jgi:hypothetical protein
MVPPRVPLWAAGALRGKMGAASHRRKQAALKRPVLSDFGEAARSGVRELA